MASIEIRAFRAEDHAAALRLWKATEGVGRSADSFENIVRFLERNPGSSFVALHRDRGEVVGTILCGHDGRRGLIHHLAVAESRRRQGLGRELVTRALDALRGVGVEKCHLLVFRENKAGRAFWEGIGAEERLTLSLFSVPTSSLDLAGWALHDQDC